MELNEGMPDKPLSPAGMGAAAGIVGGLLVTALNIFCRLAGLAYVDQAALWGNIVGGPNYSWFWGLTLHLIAAASIGIIYGKIFERLWRWGPGVGAMLGVAHWIMAGIVLGFIDRSGSWGFFAAQHGLFAAGTYFVSHFVYGAMVGQAYARARGRLAVVSGEQVSGRKHPPTSRAA